MMERSMRISQVCGARKPDLEDAVESDLDKILAGMDGDLDKQRAYAARLSLDLESSPDGHAFFNGKHFTLDDVRSLLHLIAGARTDEGANRTSCGTSKSRSASNCRSSSTRSVSLLSAFSFPTCTR